MQTSWLKYDLHLLQSIVLAFYITAWGRRRGGETGRVSISAMRNKIHGGSEYILVSGWKSRFNVTRCSLTLESVAFKEAMVF